MNTMIYPAAFFMFATGLSCPLGAALVEGDREYREGSTELQGYAAYEGTKGGRRPGILIVHEWMGINPYIKSRVSQLAKLGYVVLAADLYGKGVRPANTDQASKQAGIYRADRGLMRARAAAGLAELRRLPGVDPSRVAVMGYCFGGGVALELARSGADVAGTASFHGNLDTPHPEDARNIKGKVIVFHGSDDPLVPASAVAAFEDEMRASGADWQLHVYGGAVHGFSNPSNGNDPGKGLAYNADADRRSWKTFREFLMEIFGQ